MVTIEKIGVEQVHILQKIVQKTFFDTFAATNRKEDMDDYLTNKLSIEQLTSELKNINSMFYMAVVDGQYIGYIKLNFGSAQNEFQTDHALEIERLYVLQEYHGQKIGQILFNHGILMATQKKVDYVWLGVWEHNQKAISFYQKNGLTAFDKHEFILGKDVQTDILMRKYITSSSE